MIDEASLTILYKRIGRPSRAIAIAAWETVAAPEMGTRVKRELVAAPTTASLRASESDRL